MALRAVPDHPKFAELKAVLNQPKGAVAGWLEMMWHFCGRFTPQGNIGKYSDMAIEAWVEWNGQPGALIAAFVQAGWLDSDPEHRLLVHDWAEHADKATKNTLLRAKLPFCTPGVRTKIPKLSTASRLPEPVPEPESLPEPVPVPAPAVVARTIDQRMDDSANTGMLCGSVGIFEMRQMAEMQSCLAVFMKSSGFAVEAAINHMTSRWNEYSARSPSLPWCYGSSYKFFMSGKWDKPDTWGTKDAGADKQRQQWDEFKKRNSE